MTTFPSKRLRRLRVNENIRNLVQEVRLSTNDLVCPIFVEEGLKEKKSVEMFCTSFETSDNGSLIMSGIESTDFFSFSPSSTKIGQTKSFVDNRTSCTRFLIFSLTLSRLNRFEGNVVMPKIKQHTI